MRIIIFVNSAPRKRAIEIRQDVERLLLRGEPKNVRIASAPRLKPHVTRDRRRANFLSAADIARHERPIVTYQSKLPSPDLTVPTR
jgi:hypothetical protein